VEELKKLALLDPLTGLRIAATLRGICTLA